MRKTSSRIKEQQTRRERGSGGGVRHDQWMCSNSADDDRCGVPRRSISGPSSVSVVGCLSAPSASQPCKYNKPVLLLSLRSITTKQRLQR